MTRSRGRMVKPVLARTRVTKGARISAKGDAFYGFRVSMDLPFPFALLHFSLIAGFRGDGPMRERIHVRIPLAKAELPTEIVVKAMLGGEEIGTTKVQHAIEYDRFGKASLHIQVNAPALPDYKGNLWREGVTLTVKAKGWKAAK